LAKFIRQGTIFRRTSDDIAKELVDKEGWEYSSKFDYRRSRGTIELDTEKETENVRNECSKN
jgi:hypothetical protein